MRPKRSLGQHFLTDENIARKIAKSLQVGKDEPVLEIGAGKGFLTKYLFEKNSDLWVSEIDSNIIVYLRNTFSELSEKIIEGDILKKNWDTLFVGNFSIIGNFPYHISSPLFFKILETRNRVDQVVCMIQYEVAQRICSFHGNKKYGILSVFLQAFYNIENLFPVSEKVFYPRPKVQSAVIRMTRNNTKNLACDEKLFFTVVKSAFNQRRKILRNSLKGIIGKCDVENVILTKRPEQLSVKDFIYLTKFVEKFV